MKKIKIGKPYKTGIANTPISLSELFLFTSFNEPESNKLSRTDLIPYFLDPYEPAESNLEQTTRLKI